MTHVPDGPVLRSLAVIATRGTSNNLFQVATLVRAATALGTTVEVLFRDAALTKLRRDRINAPEWSDAYSAVDSELTDRLRAADFVDMESFLRDAKQHGDDVHYWACAESLVDVQLDDLTPLIDGPRSVAEFDATARAADAMLSF